MPIIAVIMGVSGSGKTTIGSLLAQRAGIVFADADDYHPLANKQKMAAGHPLTDEDRQPWLETLHGVLNGWYAANTGGVLACSALKEKYRQTLVGSLPTGAVSFVVLELSREVLEQRMASRHHEFMNPGLLDSQLATLESPGGALHIPNDRSPEDVVQNILQQLQPKP